MKTLRLAQCVHSELEIRPAKCFLSIINHESNSEHFFIASQDVKLLKRLEDKIACPYLTIKINAIFLNKPTQASRTKAKENVDSALATDYELSKLKEIKKEVLNLEDEPKETKPRKIRGKNPLSCRKKKIKPNQETEPSTGKRRRKRKHKVSKHIRKLLKSNEETV